jgi:hypothetical protein
MEETPFWSSNLSLLFYPEILPTSSMTSTQKWNATSRLILLISVVVSLLRGSLDSLVLGVIILGLIALAYPYFVDKKKDSTKLNLEKPLSLPPKPLASPSSSAKLPPSVPLMKPKMRPTKNNPFMNINTLQLGQPESFQDELDIVDSLLLENSQGASNPSDSSDSSDSSTQSKEIDKHFYQDLFRDTSDIYGKVHSQRQFYTMPVTTIPNDQEKFANWLYG